MWDKDTSTPPNARVDAKGVALDSDSDGVVDYLDKEPHSAPGYPTSSDGVAQVPKPDYINKNQVEQLVDAKIKDYDLTTNTRVNWFLPNINFGSGSYSVSRAEYEKLYQIAKVIQDNPQMNFVVKGFTDKSASDKYNNVLSFNRAASTIDHLVNTYNIPRSRLILQREGESENIVPANNGNKINRRVEIAVAKAGEVEMEKPGNSDTNGNFRGNKTGY